MPELPARTSSASAIVIDANVEMYRDLARRYDASWSAVLGDALDPALKRDLLKIASSFPGHFEKHRCLDCGAGTGAVTLEMLVYGWDVTAVDVSPEMLDLLRDKIGSRLAAAKLVNQSIEAFLATPGPSYHLIAFNSVLHHIYDYQKVIELAIHRLAPGGYLYTNVDPVISSHAVLKEIFDSFDTIVAKLLHDRSDLIPGAFRRLRKLTQKTNAEYGRKVASPGDLAEFHARSGVNDLSILQQIRARNLNVVEYMRYPLARTAATDFINRILGLRQQFKIIAQLPCTSD